jgi:hypothetical protein
MDAAAVIAALASGDTKRFLDSLEWDQRDVIVLPDGQWVILARLGLMGVRLDPDGEMAFLPHDHGSYDEARECHSASVALARQRVDEFVAFAQAMTEFHVGSQQGGASLSAPRDLTALLGGMS